MGVHIGGKDSYKQFEKGDIVCSLQWVNDEPALILWPKVKRIGSGAFVVCLSSAWKYATPQGYPTAYLVEQSIKAAEVMCLEPHNFTLKAIADAIFEHIPDLVEMPPTPQDWTGRQVEEAIGEMAVKIEGQTVTQQEITVPRALQ
jgi:hypothetical protein